MDFGVASHMALTTQAEADGRDALDDYIEAHVHGPLLLARVALGEALARAGYADSGHALLVQPLAPPVHAA